MSCNPVDPLFVTLDEEFCHCPGCASCSHGMWTDHCDRLAIPGAFCATCAVAASGDGATA